MNSREVEKSIASQAFREPTVPAVFAGGSEDVVTAA